MNPSPTSRQVVYRHSVLVRVTHWVNAVALFVLLMSGLNIFNAHPALYWGKKSHFDTPALSMNAVQRPGGQWAGVTQVGAAELTTTGVLGLSRTKGVLEARAFPAWATIPGTRDLATARHWHFFFAWVLVLNALAYVSHGLVSRHVQRDLWAPARELKRIPIEAWHHLQLKFARGDEARRYNVLQKVSYLGVVFVLGPLIVLTGLSMSPGINAGMGHILPEMFGGRQSARTIHFICAGLFALFILVHLVMVVLSGPINNLRSMITGRYALPPAKAPPEAAP